MNIIYHVSEFPKLSESFILNEIYSLSKAGHDVSVYAKNRTRETIQHSEFPSLDLQILYEQDPSFADICSSVRVAITQPRVLTKLPPGTVKRRLLNLYFAKQILDYAASLDSDIDLIHSHFCTPERSAGILAAAALEVPFVVTTHAFDIFTISDRYVKWVNNASSRVITISEYNRDYLRDEIGVSTPIDVIPTGIRIEKFEPAGETVPGRLLTVARLVDKKGIQYALEAFNELQSEYTDLEYHIVGEGPRREDLITQVEELGIADSVSFLGSVSDDRLLREYDQAQVFVLPSVIAENGDRDGVPVVLKESMAMETPCVSTTVSGIPELITDRESGLLVPPRDSASLKDAISALLSNAEERESLSSAARTVIEDHHTAVDQASDLVGAFRNSM